MSYIDRDRHLKKYYGVFMQMAQKRRDERVYKNIISYSKSHAMTNDVSLDYLYNLVQSNTISDEEQDEFYTINNIASGIMHGIDPYVDTVAMLDNLFHMMHNDATALSCLHTQEHVAAEAMLSALEAYYPYLINRYNFKDNFAILDIFEPELFFTSDMATHVKKSFFDVENMFALILEYLVSEEMLVFHVQKYILQYPHDLRGVPTSLDNCMKYVHRIAKDSLEEGTFIDDYIHTMFNKSIDFKFSPESVRVIAERLIPEFLFHMNGIVNDLVVTYANTCMHMIRTARDTSDDIPYRSFKKEKRDPVQTYFDLPDKGNVVPWYDLIEEKVKILIRHADFDLIAQANKVLIENADYEKLHMYMRKYADDHNVDMKRKLPYLFEEFRVLFIYILQYKRALTKNQNPITNADIQKLGTTILDA